MAGLIWLWQQGGPVNNTLTHTKANITFTGGSHSSPTARTLAHTKANFTFAAGTHTTSFAAKLTETKANVTFTGGSHTPNKAVRLQHAATNVTFAGGSHSTVVTFHLLHSGAAFAFAGGSHTLTYGTLVVPVGPSPGSSIPPRRRPPRRPKPPPEQIVIPPKPLPQRRVFQHQAAHLFLAPAGGTHAFTVGREMRSSRATIVIDMEGRISRERDEMRDEVEALLLLL